MKKAKDNLHFTAVTAEDDWETKFYAADGCETCHGRGWVRLRLPAPLYLKGSETKCNCPECGGGHSRSKYLKGRNPN